MTTRPQTLIDGLRDIVSSTTHGDCVARIEMQAQRLFGELQPTLVTGDTENLAGAEGELVLRARGRVVGRIIFLAPESLAEVDGDELEAFAAHSALALDNARMLEDHDRRARRDPLTGLLNRGEFHDYLARWVAQTSIDPTLTLSLAVFDLDHFKLVNDEAGHSAGDRLLRSTAAALTAACRSTDAAFRLGGDEFALLLPGASGEDANAIALRAAQAIGRLEGSTGASWGVATMPVDAGTREGLVMVADADMYARKGRAGDVGLPRKRDAASRLEVASRLAGKLTELHDPAAIASAVVNELHSAFGYYLAVIHRLDGDHLRVLAGAGQLADHDSRFLAWEQSIHAGINGRVARTCTQELLSDTRLDPDYLGVDPAIDPGSELSTPIVVDGRVWGVLNLEQLATHGFDEYDVMLANAIVAQAGAAFHRCSLVHEMEHSFSTTLGVLCDALESKDAYTAEHAEEVAALAMRVAVRLGLPEAQLRGLRYCALLHDIGKIGVRSELLTKPSALTPQEYAEVQEHSAVGGALLGRIPLLADIGPLVRAVHERWDGRGYPDGVAGIAIPLESRIVAVCDAWHAMIADRPYRKALSRTEAMRELARGSGAQFDPSVVRAFIKTVEA